MGIKEVYKYILQLYPKQYRERFSEEQEYVFEEILKEKGNGVEIVSFLFADICKGLIGEYYSQTKQYFISDSMQNSKIPFLVSGFFVLLSAVYVAGLTLTQYVFNNSTLLNHVNPVWIVIPFLFAFPSISLIISAIDLAVALFHSWKTTFVGDFIMSNLPMIALVLISIIMLTGYTELFFFHDSNHCISYLPYGLKSIRECIMHSS